MTEPQVLILLATHNGERFLAEQLDSIIAQTYPHWIVFASDDGSNDRTLPILEAYKKRIGEEQFKILSGPCKGSARNFLSLIGNKKIQGAFYAYADQDDIWTPDKLARALLQLNTIPEHIPALYCSRTKLINETGKEIGYSPLFKKPPGFLNAMVQNIGGGNTMIFNQSAAQLLRETKESIQVVSHDWWLYLLVSGAGGQLIYDAIPTVNYRQHANNLIGNKLGLYHYLTRIRRLFEGRFKQWSDINTEGLLSMEHRLTRQNRAIVHAFILARNARLVRRLLQMKRLGVYRQSFWDTIGLYLATIMNKI